MEEIPVKPHFSRVYPKRLRFRVYILKVIEISDIFRIGFFFRTYLAEYFGKILPIQNLKIHYEVRSKRYVVREGRGNKAVL